MTDISPRDLPAVHDILAEPSVAARIPTAGRSVVVDAVRRALEALRLGIQSGTLTINRIEILSRAVQATLDSLDDVNLDRLSQVINATGVILHTSLGRAPLARQAADAVSRVVGHCNLEVDPRTGERRQRGYQVDAAWRQLTGTEASLVVNNNAAATLLTLQALCHGREVIISRGQLIEIGGSFRLPEIFALSGSTLKEVGTTNRTHLTDYAAAIGPTTGAILRVHPSNYRVVGFSQTPSISELVGLGKQHGLLVIDDIGSGSLLDLTRFGLPPEPTFGDSLQAGADVVLGSGDKLLGGPQCGIILGRRQPIDVIRKHPLARTVRIDKMTLGALSATLELYCQGTAEQSIPVLQMLMTTPHALKARGAAIVAAVTLGDTLTLELRDDVAEVGGGSMPTSSLPTTVIAVRHASKTIDELARAFRVGSPDRDGTPRVFGRIQHDRLLLDLRSVLPEQDGMLVRALIDHAGA